MVRGRNAKVSEEADRTVATFLLLVQKEIEEGHIPAGHNEFVFWDHPLNKIDRHVNERVCEILRSLGYDVCRVSDSPSFLGAREDEVFLCIRW